MWTRQKYDGDVNQRLTNPEDVGNIREETCQGDE